MDICYALVVEVDGKVDSVRLFWSRKTADEQMQRTYAEMKNLNYVYRSIDSTQAIVVTENTYIKMRIEEMEII